MDSEVVCVKFKLEWNLFSSKRKAWTVSFLGQIRKILSTYLVKSIGLVGWVLRNFCRITDINMVAIVGEKAAPMAVTWVC